VRRLAGPGAGLGCLGCGALAAPVIGLGMLLFSFGFFALLYAAGQAMIPEGLRGPFEAWMQGTPPDDPAYVLAAELGPEPPPEPGGLPVGLPPGGGPTACGFRWPLDPGVGALTQPFIPGRHHGVDIGIPEGTPVYAPADGQVLWAGWLEGGYGVAVMVGAGKTRFILAHLLRPLVGVGQTVRAGEPVGLSGNTGRSTGPHLHFEVRVGGQAVDPLSCRPGPPPGPTGGVPGGGGFFVPGSAAVGRAYVFAFAGPAGEGTKVAVQVPPGRGPFYVWPADRPDLALPGGAQVLGAAAVRVGPAPGEAWLELPARDGVFYAVSFPDI
jgi:hypothetical protein